MRLILVVSYFICFSSCYRDSTCDCYKKKGCVLIFAIQTSGSHYIVEKTRYCPVDNYDLDTGYRQVVKTMRAKYDSISRLTNSIYKIGFMDSVRYDTIRIKGYQLSEYRSKGYGYNCWE